MAQFVVYFVVDRLGDLLIEKATFLHGVKQNVEQIRVELSRMQCFLKDADKRQDEDDSIRNWVSEIREVAYDAEDEAKLFPSCTPSNSLRHTNLSLGNALVKISAMI